MHLDGGVTLAPGDHRHVVETAKEDPPMTASANLPRETAFAVDTSAITFGSGATREVGAAVAGFGAKRVLVVTDPRLAKGETVGIVLDALGASGIEPEVFDRVRVEPTDASFGEAIAVATAGRFDGYVAVGGGSAIDTAKAANLYATYPADLLAYVNPPIGEGRPVPGPLKPLVAIPTTAGTGSETTGVAIFDLVARGAKTGIAHRRLRPSLGIVDPENTRSLPPMVAACAGLDVLCHALESYTALPYSDRPAPERPELRPAYQGANPVSDIWAERAIAMAAAFLVRAVTDPADDEARAQMLLAATYAGIGFGNAGVHLPHGMSYPVSGLARGFVPAGYPDDHPIVPHGMSVILPAPAVFRFTAPADPARHLHAAALLGADTRGAAPKDAGDLLANQIVSIMRQTGMPNGLSAVGIGPEDVDRLVAGTVPQHRVTKLSPRPASEADLRVLFLAAMTCW
ncbi:MAG: Alcohol dehydrogenase; Adhfe1 homolog [uncultured Thermomicrobiales bacterium]|uniref:hydroxyacid-oxoacid transhydrogenase n=1 Tax=uncultured Thermomicrobiales bacterium TaxID=1645740 RepID=A0A6J4TYN8_9BACT|nr:MAG: Alcohol dehydrogenase; Adhfe1 homolog [uncultured Thermomicrobiales bacterium]